jgi:hemoglobin-like flavoprotein
MEIRESLQKVLEARDLFGTIFYQEFFSRYPEVKKYFVGVDMDRQALVLTMALTVIEHHQNGSYGAVQHYLQHLGTAHHRRGSPLDLYPKWIETMLHTLERFLGEDWDLALSEEWRHALEKTFQAMQPGYQRRIGI